MDIKFDGDPQEIVRYCEYHWLAIKKNARIYQEITNFYIINLCDRERCLIII